ncbi:protease inhibitor I42 family protein [Mucilaginibacter sp. KACC 22063]|uniref:protease inhibitor I42 family protein n=1 Tax=Mucilaginibacter sp. KACC 22063 TaxID=3025666 RepID=UPI00236651EE|nr:protease inhibitor I42 family protein [Mucilaginibacter sp. KACC 22063]WDF56949.1 protease inhibitor I42 family protein [Mucilaginibacter sp. KACC 22063]
MTKNFAAIILISLFAFASCKKDNNEPVKTLTEYDSGKTLAVKAGQTFLLTLGNPGDNGYRFNDPILDASILTLISHSHKDPSNKSMMGDFGTDTWKFSAMKTGSSVLKITASRTKTDSIPMFTDTIAVQ